MAGCCDHPHDKKSTHEVHHHGHDHPGASCGSASTVRADLPVPEPMVDGMRTPIRIL